MFGGHHHVTLGCEGMMTHTSRYGEKDIPTDIWTGPTPSALTEYGFYFYMFYTILGGAYGLFVNNVASGLLILLLILCLSEVGVQAMTVIRVLAFPLGCGIAYSFIQVVFFEEPLSLSVRGILIWMVMLVLVQSLAFRTNFVHRFIFVMLLFGLAALPYVSVSSISHRAAMGRAIGFGHTNSIAEWYGFLTVYFAVRGFVARINMHRILSWIVAIGCLYMVALAVGRGPLLAIAVAILISTRHSLKSGFLPLLLLVLLIWGVMELGVFDDAVYQYRARGTEETGRLAVWPHIIDSFLESPWIGVGAAHVGAFTESGSFVTPHNGFLYIAQSSGIIPFGLFIAYWWRAGLAVLKADARKSPDAVYYAPLFAYAFLMINASNFSFTEAWASVVLAIPLTASVQRQALDFPGPLRRGVGAAGFEVAK
jgi:O-antigen ligase